MHRPPLAALVVLGFAAAAVADPLHRPQSVAERVRVTTYGRHAIDRAGLAAAEHRGEDAAAAIFPVTELTADAARVLVEGDEARLLLWIERRDLMSTVARPTRISGRGGAGVWLQPGAPIATTGSGRRVGVHYQGQGFAVDGTLERRALGHRYRPIATSMATDRSATRFAREPNGAVLVEASAPLPVRVVSRGRGGWVVIEYRDAEVRIVGWAREADLTDDLGGLIGTGGGSGYGISDTDRVELEPGTCLLADDGTVVGLQLARQTRYANDLGGGRWSVYVGTPWGLVNVIAVDLAGGTGTPRWKKC